MQQRFQSASAGWNKGVRPPAAAGARPAAAAGWGAAASQGVKPTPAAASGLRPGTPGTVRPPTGVRPAQSPAAAAAAAGAKPAAAAQAAAAAAAAYKEQPSLTVSTQSKKDEIGIQTLVGDYAEKGTNHGRKYFQKTQKIQGHEDIKVFLYYWDTRDGPDFSGWWFGDQLGGSQVWARANSHGQQPPRVGWKIPWDAAKAEPGILFVDPYKASATGPTVVAPAGKKPVQPAVAPAAAAAPAVNSEEIQARLRKATGSVDAAEATCKEVLEVAKSVTAGTDVQEATLTEVETSLKGQVAAIADVQKSLTDDITEARKGGPSATTSVTELSKLSPRVRKMQMEVQTQLSKVSASLKKVQSAAAMEKKAAEAAAANKAAEQKDTKELDESLPAAEELVSAAEDAVESVSIMASPLIADPPDEGDDMLSKALTEVETAAVEAQNKISEARKQINAKLQGARKYAPETRMNALTKFSAMQHKLTEAQKKLNPYKSFRKEFQDKVEVKKALTEITEKLGAAELEVEKAAMMSSAAEQGQMSEDEVASAEKTMTPAQTSIAAAMRIIETKLRVATGNMKDELTQLKDKGAASKQKLEGVQLVLRRQREGLTTQQMLTLASEKVERAEESLTKCQEAEMPFLKGIEILPPDESSKALGESEAAAAQAESAIGMANNFLRSKLAEAKRYSKDLAKSVTEELTTLQGRIDAANKKLQAFKKDTMERKVASIMAEVVDAVSAAETKIKTLTETAEIFSKDLDEASTESLKAASERTSAAEKEASAACLEARKLIAKKQKEAKGGEDVAALSKLQGRVNTAQQELAKTRKVVLSGEKLIKGKEVLTEEEKKIKEAEDEVAKMEKMADPEEGAKPSDEAINEMDAAVKTAQKALKTSARSVETHLPGAVPALKAALQKLLERCKAAQDKITKLLASTKEQRERVLSEAFVKEGVKKAEEVEAAMEKVNDAELPFLKGIEVLPLKEATETIAESENAAMAVQKAISEARTFIATKNLELRQYDEAVAKPASEEFTKMTERVNAAASKLAQFRKDTEGRKKTAQLQEAAEKMTTAEEFVKKLAEVIEPFCKEETDELSAEEAAEACEKLSTAAKQAQSKIDEVSSFLMERTKEMKGSATHGDTLSKLQARLTETTKEFSKSKKVASEREGGFVAKKILKEANDQVGALEDETKKAAEACAPLLEQGGEEFLVSNSLILLGTVLREYSKEKELTEDALFEQIEGVADGKVSEDAFVAYLTKLPEKIEREEVGFPESRRKAMFKSLDKDEDGSITAADFKGIFKKKYICVKGISVTDVFEISKSKTVGKIEAGEILEALTDPKSDESNGMSRIECLILSTEKTGFVTISGNQGTLYLEAYSPFMQFCTGMDKVVEESAKSVQKASSFLVTKTKELASAGSSGPLAEVRGELQKLRPKVTQAQTSLDQTKKKVQAAKKEFLKKEVAEKNAHIEAKERKQAEAITGAATLKVEAVEAAAKKLDETTSPITSLDAAGLEGFATPASSQEETEKLFAAANESVTEAKAVLKEEVEKLSKTVKGPLLEAKKDLQKMQVKVDTTARACRAAMEAVRKACRSIVDVKSAKVSAALRAQVQKRGVTLDAFFEELVKPGEDRISEASFCRHLETLEGTNFAAEQMTLLFRHIEAGGIGRRRFFSFLQQYFHVVKAIAITNEFDIAKAKTIRKAEIDELIEVLEGPCTDEKLKMTRIKGRSLTDATEGWISVKGNQGTPFLQEVEKPYYSCKTEVDLDKDFKTDEPPLRKLKADEVLELIEGPRKETFAPGLRIRGKAATDGVQGWITIRDKKGNIMAEADGKHYSCITSVAMTDELDIKNCKVIRKLSVGETFLMIEDPVEDSGITRMKGRTLKDEKDGYVTIKGNAGTVYAEPNSKLYSVLQDVSMTKLFKAVKPEEVREIKKGEAIQVLEGPKEEPFPPETRLKGRALSDGLVGWITLKSDNVVSWSPYYKCLKAAPMHDALAVEGANVLRELVVGETLELIEGPKEEGKELRMKAKAEKDGSVGWVTIKDGEGKKLLDSC